MTNSNAKGKQGERIQFTVPALPIPQPRQKHGTVKIGGKTVSRNYLDGKNPVHAYKAAVQHAVKEAYDGPMLECPLAMEITFVFPRPKRMVWKKKPMPRAWHFGQKDLDNLMKSTCDAMNKVLFRDDGQICSCTLEKVIASGDEMPHAEIAIVLLDDLPELAGRLRSE